MSEDLEETRKLNNPYYKIMELDQKELQIELNNWSRERLIDWLAWNDRNGVYTDEDSLDEFGNILGKEEAIEIIMRQILEG